MPNCFQLWKKGANEPSRFNEIDTELCAHLGVPEDAVKYVYHWYDIIGFAIAVGKPLGSEELREYVKEFETVVTEEGSPLMKILAYLEEHYTSNAWVEIGKR